jgi:hypothetical protein
MVTYNNNIYLFAGIHKITFEKNDLWKFNIDK